MSTRPQRSNANCNPAAPLLEGKCTCHSTTEVAHGKAELEAKWLAVLKKNDDDLRKLEKLEHELDAQEKENTAQAARPPPEQPLAAKKPTSAPLTPRPHPCPRPSKPNGHAAADNDSSEATPAGQRVQPGHIKRLRREDLEAHCERESVSDPAVPAGATSSNGKAVDVDKEVAVTEDAGQAQSASGWPKKRKSDVTGEDKPAKKGKPSKLSGPTAATTVKFAVPLTATHSSVISPGSVSVAAPHPATSSAPQGMYIKDVGGLELDNADATAPKEDGLTIEAAAKQSKNIIQLEVIDVAISAAPATSAPTTKPVQPPTAATPTAPPKGGWAMRHLKPILTLFISNFPHIFVPRLIDYIGNTASGPWKLTGVNLTSAMKDLTADSFPQGLTFPIAPRQPFYEVAKQKLSEYRNGVRNEAIEVKKHGLYQSTLIAEMFAYHLFRIGKSSDQIRDYPCNTMALTAAAVECALKMWRSGSYVPPLPCTEEAKFSDQMWGSCAQQYLEGITDLSERQWTKILAKADKALRGYNIDSEDKLDDEQDPQDVPLTGRARIDDDNEVKKEVEEESWEMDRIEMTSTAGTYTTD